MSPRPKSVRKVLSAPPAGAFVPKDSVPAGEVCLHIEEYEALRLCDYLMLTQQQASLRMGVSRPTFTRIYASARSKIATALAQGLMLRISGGTAFKDGAWFRCLGCGAVFNNINPHLRDEDKLCPVCYGADKCTIMQEHLESNQYTTIMKKIVLPTREGRIDDHFGHCEYYTVFTVDADNKVVSVQEMPSPQGCGCKSNVASIFQEMGVTLMLAGNMGMGALNKLNAHGVEVIRGCSGEIMQVLQAYLAGTLKDSGESCSHHHGDGDHQCPNH